MSSNQVLSLAHFSEQSLIVFLKQGRLNYDTFCQEIARRMIAGEIVHPYHAECAVLKYTDSK